MNSNIVIGTVIGLIAGLVLGVFIGVLFISSSSILPIKAVNPTPTATPTPTPTPTPTASSTTGAGTNNQVQVSGTIQEANPSEISFSSIYGSSQTIDTSSLITHGQYSVVLVGNQSYAVTVDYQYTHDNGVYSTSNTYSIYVPSGVTTFTANF